MDIALKYRILEKIVQINDDNLLNEIKLLVGLSESDFWAEIPSEVRQAITQSKLELDGGAGIPHAEVMEEVERFLGKR